MTTNLVDTLSAAASTNPGISLFAGNPALTEDQQLERLATLVGMEPEPKQEAAPVVAAPVATEQPVVETPPVAAPEVVAPEAVEPARMAVPAVDLEALERELTESGVDEETAKRLATGTIGRLAQASAVAAAEIESSRRDRIVAKLGTVYPEIKRPGVMEMIAPAGSTDAQIQARILTMYGDRKGEMRSQVSNQMTAPVRKAELDKPKTQDEIEYAAFAEYFNSGGNLQKAKALKQELERGR